MVKESDIPRWAKPLGEKTWGRIKELLYDGWQPRAVMRDLKLPESKLRSLTLLARKYRYRRVIAPVSRLREALAGGVAAMGTDTLKLLQMAIQQGLTDEKKSARVAQMLGEFVDRVERLAQRAEEAEARQKREETGDSKTDAIAAFREAVRSVGIVLDGDRTGG